jgi:hypothetical protein
MKSRTDRPIDRIVQPLIWISAVAYLWMWGVGWLPWVAALALELILCIIWDKSAPDARWQARMSGEHCHQLENAEDETQRIARTGRRRSGGSA